MSGKNKKRTAVLVSGGGTNLQAILDAKQQGDLPHADIALVLSSCKDAFALTRAKKMSIPTETLADIDFGGRDNDNFDIDGYDEALLPLLKKYNIEIIVLAGFLVILGKKVIAEYKDKIINIHPSLIPSFCGEGYYGLFVHEAALKRGVKITGATVHFVDEIIDGGKIILQKAVEVKENDTPESLQKRVMEEAEWEILPKALEIVCGRY
ncbi:phosphoribosylglycinamide formyltransferase [Spirochaetia bacterium]|nr:phosphoribosylglycinamide formyltransferase [Spirochaetia bacterium]